ncbi:DUF1801 domain-containing protein [Patescibacteria group bacterium]|nr:DUF1801 domain-containing protein [Patescibacteria group bacterium]
MTVIDQYLQKIEPAKREQLERIRLIAKRVVPEAEETISYGMPTLKLKGKAFLGFDAHRKHIGIYPFSGEVTNLVKDELTKLKYKFSPGAIQVPVDRPIPEKLLQEIIQRRLSIA